MENPPPYFTPVKDRRRHIIAMLCFGLIALLLIWTVWANLRQNLVSPQMDSALTALNTQSLGEAKTHFESALREDPHNPLLYEQILEACQKSGDWELMVLFGERAISACRESPEPVRATLYGLLVQGYTHAKGKNWKRLARNAAQRAFELQPTDPNIQNLYGYTLVDTFAANDKPFSNPKDLDAAEQLIVRAMNTLRNASPLGSADPALALNLTIIEDSYAWLLVKRERYDEAAKLLSDIAARIDSDDFGTDVKEIFYHLGVAYSRLGREDDARQALQRALAYDPKFPEATLELHRLPTASIPAKNKKN